MWKSGLRIFVALQVIWLSAPALAQRVLAPGESRPEPAILPDAREEAEMPPLDLPTIDSEVPRGAASDYGDLEVFVERFQIEGSTVFSASELSGVTAPWTGRRIRTADLLAARDAISRLYLGAGYATSGAVIPDQDVRGGVVTILVIEGRLTDLEIDGNEHFASSYLRARLSRAAQAPVHVPTLERALLRLEAHALIDRLDATLTPGGGPGESSLLVHVSEASRFGVEFVGSNEHTPALGAWGGGGSVGVGNLVGHGDRIRLRADFSEGIDDYELELSLPMNRWDTALVFRYRYVDVDVVDAPLPSFLEPHGSWEGFSLALEQPLVWHPRYTVSLGVELERIETESLVSVFGRDLCLLGSSCRSVVVPLRLRIDASHSWEHSAIAARSTLSFGLDALGADRSADFGRETFVSWLGQAQAIHVLPEDALEARISTRFDLQLASDPLLPAEKLSLGGLRTVRGYSENQRLRDNGLVASVELGVPVYRSPLRRTQLHIGPFTDLGYGWNQASQRRERDRSSELVSVGVTARLSMRSGLEAELSWGLPLVGRPNTRDEVQNMGLHFVIRLAFP